MMNYIRILGYLALVLPTMHVSTERRSKTDLEEITSSNGNTTFLEIGFFFSLHSYLGVYASKSTPSMHQLTGPLS